MDKSTTVIVLGTAHRLREPGKGSPDGRLKEAVYSREIAKSVYNVLIGRGYKAVIDYEPLDLPKNMWSSSVTTERSRELNIRVNYVNEVCRQNGAKNVIYISIHVNAVGTDSKWHDAGGWQVCVSTKASSRSKLLANSLFDAAKSKGLKMRQPTATQKFWAQSLKVLNDTNCAAILTENLFQDNKKDVDYLLSKEGRQNIVDLHVEGILNFVIQN